MTIQTIWTALPNSYDTDHYYFSVFVSHRLSGGATGFLQDYKLGPPADPTNWARSMEALVLQVSFDGGATYHPAQRIPPGQPHFWAPLEPTLWTKIFPGGTETLVDSYVPQSPFSRSLRTYRAVALAKNYETLYGTVAQNFGGNFPPVSDPSVSDYVQTIGRFQGLWDALNRQFQPRGDGPPANIQRVYLDWLQTNVAGHFGNMSAAAQQIAVEHYLAWRFYRRNLTSQYGPRDPSLVNPVPVPQAEFHKLVGMLADHPTLMRMLGIAMDFRTSRNVPVAPEGLLRVRAHWPGSPADDPRVPETLYRINANGFFAREKSLPSDLLNGSLIPANYDVVQVDVDGHAQKMIGYALTAATASNADPNAPESLPARRGGGLTFMQDDRVAKSVIPQLKQVDTLNTTLAANDPKNPVQLDVHDVTRGYRVDVWDGSGTWKSLCRREGTDIVDGTISVGIVAPDREGVIKALGGTRGDPSSDPTEQNTLYVHEALFGWDGWSLCAQRPGRAIGEVDGDANQHPILGFLENHAATGYPVTSRYRVTPGSLPRLRYGQTYSFRVRLVDLACNGLAFDHDSGVFDPALASTQAAYLRYEPIAAPALVLRRKPTDGESLETVVIRSHPAPVTDLSLIVPGNNATTYSLTANAIAAGFLPICERHVAPPKTSQIMTETLGMLDGLTPQDAFRVSAKEAGKFTDDTVYNIDTGNADPLPAGELVFDPPISASNPFYPPSPGQLVYHALDTLTIPYLPDPLARGLTLQFPTPGPTVVPPLDPTLPSIAEDLYAVDPKGWPRVSATRLIVDESTTANITYARAPGTFTIGLPPATLQTVRFSSPPAPAHIKQHAVWAAIAGNVPAEIAALRGLNWLLSPYRELHLVHAVQQPLLIPSFAKGVAIDRDVGWTYVLMRGAIHNDGRSTVHVDVNATWVDPYDDVNDPTGPHVDAPDPRASYHTGRAFEVPVKYTDTTTLIGAGTGANDGPQRHEFGDTKHRWVTYSPDATSRYREYFPPAVDSDPSTSVITTGQTQILNVLASKRPDPMEVLYAVPTFKWERSPDGTTATRIGRGIRIYFDRPWFVTGADELVGVLLMPTPMVDPNLVKYTSEWGRDPVWTSTSVAEPLQPGHFTNRVLVTPEPAAYDPSPPPLSMGPFALAEDSTLSVNVVGFQPEFNSDRQLWFVDIEMDPGDSYFPFVRLALTRYQPHAVWPGSPSSQHLSRMVRTEFLQLVPDRTASITYNAGNILTLTVSGVGGYNDYAVATSAFNAATAASAHNVTGQVQSRPLGSGNDLLWTNVGQQSLLSPLQIVAPDLVTWTSRVLLPANPDASLEYRLLVKETESYKSDGDVADGLTGNTPFADRLVYACGIPLTLK